MKLQELAVTRPTKQIAKVFESHFDQRISFDSMNRNQMRGMLQRVRGLVNEHRASPAFHHSEKNPAYLKLMMMEQALTQQLREYGSTTAADANPAATAALATAQQQQKKKQMQDEIKQKQKEIAELQKAMMNPTMAAENNTGNFLRESEIQQAQVVGRHNRNAIQRIACLGRFYQERSRHGPSRTVQCRCCRRLIGPGTESTGQQRSTGSRTGCGNRPRWRCRGSWC